MPVLIALAIRSIIQMVVTLGIITFAEKTILPMVNNAIAKVIELFGVSEEDAQAFVSNGVIAFAEEVGIGVLTLRAKLPTKVAERLGFTSKGWAKRSYSKAGETKLPKVVSAPKVGAKPTTADATEIAQQVAKTRGLSFDLVSKAASIIVATLGVPVGVGLLITNTIDFGAWNSSAYQSSFQRFLSIFGLEPDKDARSPRTTSKETFDKVFNALKLDGATTLRDPYKDTILPFTRDNLLDLVDKLAASILVESGEVKTKVLLAAVLPLVAFAGKAPIVTAPTVTAPTVTARIVPQVRVVSGIVSQGIIGSTATFTPRQDDLIENESELTEAAHNNIAPFIAALGKRLSYEIKLVPSVKTADGFTQRGTAQRIISGYNRDGSPKYRTVVNRFAVANIYMRTERGTQSKIATLILGPVDSARFQTAGVNITAVATSIQQNIITQAEEISAPQTTRTATNREKMTRYGISLYKNEEGRTVYYERGGFAFIGGVGEITDPQNIPTTLGISTEDIPQLPGKTQDELIKAGLIDFARSKRNYTAKELAGHLEEYVKNEFPEKQILEIIEEKPTPQTPAGARNLYEYYKAHEQPLPSVEERSKLYEQLGLGQSGYYTGTAEQNTKLLAALQGARL